ncbi:MAG: ABC transporter ATP-binding protein [Rhodothermales bacterium]
MADDQKERESEKTPVYDGRLFGRILSYLAPYRGWVTLALVLSVLAAYLGPVRPKLIQIAIDDHIVSGDSEGLRFMILLLFLVLFGEAILDTLTSYLTQWVGQQAIFDLRSNVFRHIQRLPLSYFDRTPVGRLITRTTNDVEALSDVLSAGVVTIMGSLLRLVFIIYFMFALNTTLALLALSVLPIMVYATFLFRRKVRDAYRETRRQVARLNAFLQEHVSGMHIVQVFNRQKEEMRRFEGVNQDHRNVQIKTIFYFALFWPSVDIIGSLALGLIIWFGGLNAMGGTLTLGVLVAFIQYVRQFFEPIRNLSDQYNTLQSAMAASERIFGVLDLDIALREPEMPVALEAVEGRIEFRGVWFTYDDVPEGTPDDEINWILRDVSFTVEPGQTVALVGATGSGKTTIISLLLRFYDIRKGQILVDGTDIRKFTLRDLRRQLGLVLQDVFLFSGTVARNIHLGADVPHDNLVQAAALVGADSMIDKLPARYEQDIRERGSALSHGQRQLLAFVRALIYNPAILLLDEATSSVDTETELIIQRALDRLLEGRTTIAVAHRLSTIRHADQILVVHRGEIRERGTHEALIAAGGLYRRLYELQYREQEITAT